VVRLGRRATRDASGCQYNGREVRHRVLVANGNPLRYDTSGESRSRRVVAGHCIDQQRARSAHYSVLRENCTTEPQRTRSRSFRGETPYSRQLFDVEGRCRGGAHQPFVRSESPWRDRPGHWRRACTGAVSDHIGLFEAAHGGTLLLDQIGDMPMSVQTHLPVCWKRHVLRLVVGPRTPRSDRRPEATGGNRLAGARLLGVGGATLFRRLSFIKPNARNFPPVPRPLPRSTAEMRGAHCAHCATSVPRGRPPGTRGTGNLSRGTPSRPRRIPNK
jgi:hypothetical protein